MLYGENSHKIKTIKITYSIQEPIKSGVCIDYSKELIGVIEYLNKDDKKKIYENGDIYQSRNAKRNPTTKGGSS